ncbi:quinoprotein relay system zinc metallohydrolase 1 [Neptuniibacter sp.]|uniref:quinoprotein relay system zinc metallohydrolase 1 n=1 Tax=Neptuniibacter sp. TaxID=1962643 RepID=UPI003B5C07F7
MTRLPIILLALLSIQAIAAQEISYALAPIKVAEDTYVVRGNDAEINTINGGNIANTGFIATSKCTIVFDTGPSKLYGQELLKAIKNISSKPICLVLNSHFHPDHFLGNAAFEKSSLKALGKTTQQIGRHGEHFRSNYYEALGIWMRDTELIPPTEITKKQFEIGGHQLSILPFSGHSGADLVLFDKTTSVLFAGDLVFHNRAPATAHTPGIAWWLNDLEKLKLLNTETIVPGHGPVAHATEAISSTSTYLTWLDQLMKKSATEGLEILDIIETDIPEYLDNQKMIRYEISRSAIHLYPKYEDAIFE